MTKNILVTGVGGQGTILASKILTNGLLEEGYDVKMSEIHGMSQRGGSVTSHVRYGISVDSPVIEEGTADLILAFEQMEALRWSGYLRKNGTVIVNDCLIYPMTVLSGHEDYPLGILEELEEEARTVVVQAEAIAEGLGNKKAANMVLLGTAVHAIGLQDINWEKIIQSNVKPHFL